MLSRWFDNRDEKLVKFSWSHNVQLKSEHLRVKINENSNSFVVDDKNKMKTDFVAQLFSSITIADNIIELSRLVVYTFINKITEYNLFFPLC